MKKLILITLAILGIGITATKLKANLTAYPCSVQLTNKHLVQGGRCLFYDEVVTGIQNAMGQFPVVECSTIRVFCYRDDQITDR